MSMSGAIKAGKAAIEVLLDDSRLHGAMRALSGRLKQAGVAAGLAGSALFGAGAGALAAFAPTIQAASDMQETMNKFNVVFGDSSDRVKAWSDGLAKDVGRSQKQIADFMAGSQDLFVPLGFDPAAAEEMSQTVTKLAIDLASFNNMSDDDSLRDLHAALTGSGEVMKKYGVIVSEAAVKQELLNQGLDPKNATESQKVQARLGIILRGTTAAQGDALRSTNGYANQMKRLWAVIDDAKVAIGNALLPTVTRWVATAGDAITVASEWAAKNPELIATVAKVAAVVMAAGAALIGIGGVLTAVGIAIPGLATLFGGLVSIVAFVASTIGAIAAPAAIAIGALTAIGVVLWDLNRAGHLAGVVEWLRGAAAAAVDAGQSALAWIAHLGQITGVTPFIASVLGHLQDLGGYLGGELFSLIGDLGSIFGETFVAAKEALLAGDWQGAGEIVMAGLQAAWQAGVATLMQVWFDFRTAMIETFAGAMIAIKGLWIDAQQTIQHGLLSMARQKGIVGDAMATILGIDLREEQKRADKTNAGLAKLGINHGPQDVFADTQAILDRANAAAKSESEDYWNGLADSARKYGREAAAKAKADADEARRNLTETTTKARERREAKARAAIEQTPKEEPAARVEVAKQEAEKNFSSVGTFSGWRLGAQFGGLETIAKEQLRELKRANEHLARDRVTPAWGA